MYKEPLRTMLCHILTRHMLTYDSSLEKKFGIFRIKKMDLAGISPKGVNYIIPIIIIIIIRKKDVVTRSLPLWIEKYKPSIFLARIR